MENNKSSTSKRINITLPNEIHNKAIKDSRDMFGEVNVSGLIKILIKQHKSKPNEKAIKN